MLRLFVAALVAGTAACAAPAAETQPSSRSGPTVELWLPDAQQFETGLYAATEGFGRYQRRQLRMAVGRGNCTPIAVLARGRIEEALRHGLGNDAFSISVRKDPPDETAFREVLVGSSEPFGQGSSRDEAIQLALVPYYQAQLLPYTCAPLRGAVVGGAWLASASLPRAYDLPLDRLIFNRLIRQGHRLDRVSWINEGFYVGLGPDDDRLALQSAMERSAYELGRDVAEALAHRTSRPAAMATDTDGHRGTEAVDTPVDVR